MTITRLQVARIIFSINRNIIKLKTLQLILSCQIYMKYARFKITQAKTLQMANLFVNLFYQIHTRIKLVYERLKHFFSLKEMRDNVNSSSLKGTFMQII